MIHTFALFFFSKSFIYFLFFWTIAKVLFYEISFSNLTFLLPSFTLKCRREGCVSFQVAFALHETRKS
jgi:hypothetical protein